MVRVVAFDLFNTIFDLSKLEKSDLRYYSETIKKPEWEPLKLSPLWHCLTPHEDVYQGLKLLRRNVRVVTMSNGPVELLTTISWLYDLTWDMVIPLQLRKVYKPHLDAYRMILDLMDVPPQEVMMVTANKSFGDLEAAVELGMHPMLLRDTSDTYPHVENLAELYDYLKHNKLII